MFVHWRASKNRDVQMELKLAGFGRLLIRESDYVRITLCVARVTLSVGSLTLRGGRITVRGGLVTVGVGDRFFAMPFLWKGNNV